MIDLFMPCIKFNLREFKTASQWYLYHTLKRDWSMDFELLLRMHETAQIVSCGP